MNTLQLSLVGLTLVVPMYGSWVLAFLDAPVTESRSSDGVTLLAQASPAKVSTAVERTGDAKSAAVESSEEALMKRRCLSLSSGINRRCKSC